MKLENKDIERLVEKYYDGTSSEQEELLLKANAEQNEKFSQHTIKSQFESLKVLRNETGLDDSFDKRIMKEIAAGSPKKFKISKSTYSFLGVATSIAAILIIWFGTELFRPSTQYNTVTDPVIAFKETRWALEEISYKLNKGLTPAKKTVNTVEANLKKSAEVNKMTEILHKAKDLQKIEKASYFLKSINKVYINFGNS